MCAKYFQYINTFSLRNTHCWRKLRKVIMADGCISVWAMGMCDQSPAPPQTMGLMFEYLLKTILVLRLRNFWSSIVYIHLVAGWRAIGVVCLIAPNLSYTRNWTWLSNKVCDYWYEFCVSNPRHSPTLINITIEQAHISRSYGSAKLFMYRSLKSLQLKDGF